MRTNHPQAISRRRTNAELGKWAIFQRGSERREGLRPHYPNKDLYTPTHGSSQLARQGGYYTLKKVFDHDGASGVDNSLMPSRCGWVNIVTNRALLTRTDVGYYCTAVHMILDRLRWQGWLPLNQRLETYETAESTSQGAASAADRKLILSCIALSRSICWHPSGDCRVPHAPESSS